MINYKVMKRLFSIFGILAFFGCSGTPPQPNHDQVCSTDAGYDAGMYDAIKKHPADPSYGAECSINTRDAARLGYRKGYTAGMQTAANAGNEELP